MREMKLRSGLDSLKTYCWFEDGIGSQAASSQCFTMCAEKQAADINLPFNIHGKNSG